MRIVLDTNVFVSALLSSWGASYKIISAIENQSFTVLASVPLFLEYESVLKRESFLKKSGFTVHDIDIVLDTFATIIEPVTIYYLWRPQLTDACDEMVLETALNGTADVLITHNIKDFVTVSARFKLRILTPGDFYLYWRNRL